MSTVMNRLVRKMDRNLSNTATVSFSKSVPLCWVYDFPNVSTQNLQAKKQESLISSTLKLRV